MMMGSEWGTELCGGGERGGFIASSLADEEGSSLLPFQSYGKNEFVKSNSRIIFKKRHARV